VRWKYHPVVGSELRRRSATDLPRPHKLFELNEFPVHPHMLRHATGYKLANDGHDTRAIQQYLGHKNIQHGSLHRAGLNPFSGLLEGLGSLGKP
jgi:integrase